MIKRIFSHTLLYSLGPHIPKLAVLFIYPLLTEHLTSHDYGVFGIISAYTGVFIMIKDMGLSISVTSTFVKFPYRYKYIWRNFHSLMLLWSFVIVLFIFIILYFIIPETDKKNFLSIFLCTCIPLLLFENVTYFAVNYLRMSQRPLPVSVISFITGCVAIVLNLYFIITKEMGYMGWFYTNFIVSLISFLLYFKYIFNKRVNLLPTLKINWHFMVKYFKPAMVAIPHNFSGYALNNADRIVMERIHVNTNSIGVYNMAYVFGNYFSFFTDAMGQALSPMYMGLFRKGNHKVYIDLTIFFQIVVLLVTCICCIWLKQIFTFLISNEELRGSYHWGIIIIMAYNYKPMYTITTNTYFFENKPAKLLLISSFSVWINIILNILFIPYYGVGFAAVSTFLCYMLTGFVGFIYKENRFYLKTKLYPVLWFCVITALTYVLFIMRDVSVNYKLISSAFICILLLSLVYKLNLVKSLSKND